MIMMGRLLSASRVAGNWNVDSLRRLEPREHSKLQSQDSVRF